MYPKHAKYSKIPLSTKICRIFITCLRFVRLDQHPMSIIHPYLPKNRLLKMPLAKIENHLRLIKGKENFSEVRRFDFHQIWLFGTPKLISEVLSSIYFTISAVCSVVHPCTTLISQKN